MSKIEILFAVNDILATKLSVPTNILTQKYIDEPLLGKVYGLNAKGLVYLLLEIERKFNITFSSSDLQNYGFISIASICSRINNLLSR
jgi:acyl carrier protein